jgi:hypothetical protein
MGMTTVNATRDANEELRQAIRASGKAPFRIGLEAKVDPTALSRFMRGKGGISLRSAGRIMAVLGLALVPRGK